MHSSLRTQNLQTSRAQNYKNGKQEFCKWVLVVTMREAPHISNLDSWAHVFRLWERHTGIGFYFIAPTIHYKVEAHTFGMCTLTD
jgi:hypothetical protein